MSNRQGNKKSFQQLLLALRGTVQASYKLVPALIIVATCLTIGVVSVIILSSRLMVGAVLLVVLTVAIVVYASTVKYGEAALALVAGVLTAYSVTWTPNRFIAFVTVWLSFTFAALIISSIKIAARTEDIYRQAALTLAPSLDVSPEIEASLRTIGQGGSYGTLGPIQRAEAIRFFAFRKLPLEQIGAALHAVETLTVITQIEPKAISAFVADIYKVFDLTIQSNHEVVLDYIHLIIQGSAVPPTDFIKAFEHSRRYILSRSLDLVDYFERLRSALESGVAPEAVGEYFRDQLEQP
jgi:uncharacterized membrane protein